MTGQVHIGVEVCGLIVQDVHIFLSEWEAETWFKEYTGLDHGTLYDEEGQCVDDEYDQTKIFTLVSEEGYTVEEIDEYLCHECGSTYRLVHGWIPNGCKSSEDIFGDPKPLVTKCPYCGKQGICAGTMISIRVKEE